MGGFRVSVFFRNFSGFHSKEEQINISPSQRVM